MTKGTSLTEMLQNLFEHILKGNITTRTIAETFINLERKGYVYSDIKNALHSAGDIVNTIPRDFYSREQIMRDFSWGERAMHENLKKWGLPSSSKHNTYTKTEIETAAIHFGWTQANGKWIKPKYGRPKKS